MPNKESKKLQGEVISDKASKTVVVKVTFAKGHPKYHKRYTIHKKYKAHDENREFHLGDIVEIEKCQPVSKRKHFKIVKVLGKNLVEIAEAQQKKAAEEIIAQVMPEEKEMEESSDVSHQTERPVNKKRMRKKEKSES